MAERAGKSDLHGMSVYLRHQTERAVLVEPVNSTREPAWVPLSQVELTPNGDGQTYWLDIPEWLAIDKGLL